MQATLSPEAFEEKLCGLLARSQKVDEATARFYMRDANGDLRTAIRQCQADKQWQQGNADSCTCFGHLKVH